MPNSDDVRAGRSQHWDPKYPDVAMEPQQGSYPEQMSGGAEYEPAPDTSHVYGFKMMQGGIVSKFYGPSIGAPAGTKAIIGVAFKPSPAKGSTRHPNSIKSEYVYAFPTIAEAERYLADFRATAHPGHVVDALIKARVWYKQVSRK